MNYKEETLNLAKERSQELADQFYNEVLHLLNSGAVDSENHNRNLLFGVAIENCADGFLNKKRKSEEYKNLKCF